MAKQGKLSLGETSRGNGPKVGKIQYDALVFEKTIRIAVSGDVRVTGPELDIINSPEFQRLRRIRQLGAAMLVYPTALHTRFDHSLGVLDMVDRMVTAIRENRFQAGAAENSEEAVGIDVTDDQRRLARLYALLHDITHVPFGHTLEDELKVFSSHDGFQKDPTDTQSLERFEAFLGRDSTIGKIIISASTLGPQLYERLIAIFKNGKDSALPYSDEFVYYLVSNTVCADLLDYLKRDSYFADIDLTLSYRFLNFLYVTDLEVKEPQSSAASSRRRVVVRLWKPRRSEARRDLLTDLGGLLDARYMVGERIYFHPAKIIAGTMLGRAVLEATLAGTISESQLREHSDDSLVYALTEQEPTKLDEQRKANATLSKRLATAYSRRELYRMKKYGDDEFAAGGDSRVDLKSEALKKLKDAIERKRYEDDIAELAGLNAGDVLIYPASESMNKKVAEVLVRWKGKEQKLAEIDDKILGPKLKLTEEAHKKLWFVGLIYPRTLSDEEVSRVRHAFEGTFLAPIERKHKLLPLVQHIVAVSDSIPAMPPLRYKEACERIAGKLAAEPAAFHRGMTRRAYVQTLIAEEFGDGSAAKEDVP